MDQKFRGHPGLPSSCGLLRTGSMVRQGQEKKPAVCSRCHSRIKNHILPGGIFTGLPERYREHLGTCSISEAAKRRMRVRFPYAPNLSMSLPSITHWDT